MVVGEPQILGDSKRVYGGQDQGAVGGFLENVVTRAFNVGKRNRTETKSDRGPYR